MTRAEFVKNIALREDITDVEANRRFGIVLEEIEKGVVIDGSLVLRNFGTFTLRNIKERMGRNPKTGEPVEIKSRQVVRFKAGKHFKSMVGK